MHGEQAAHWQQRLSHRLSNLALTEYCAGSPCPEILIELTLGPLGIRNRAGSTGEPPGSWLHLSQGV